MRIAVVSLLTGVVLLSATASSALTLPAHTKKQAELNVLRFLARTWRTEPQLLVDRRTHLIRDNTEAVCKGRGRAWGGLRYRRFLCVVRPRVHRPGQGLYLEYRARRDGQFAIRRLRYRCR
jgi:hypothetical protein